MSTKPSLYPVLGLLTGATVWGLIWYPFRVLNDLGMQGVVATFLVFCFALGLGLIVYRRALVELSTSSWLLLAIALAAGWTNIANVIAVIHGEVVRVMLLFYLAPLWTVFLSRYFLGERLNNRAWGVMLLAISGALVMLWRPQMGWPWPKNSAEWIAISAGVAFALSNVLTRKITEVSVPIKALTIWSGVVLVALIWLLIAPPTWPVWSEISATAVSWLIIIGGVIFIATAGMQYGLTHIAANRAIVILLFELVVIAISSYFLANESLSLREWLGGAMIVAASLFSGAMETQKEGEK